LSQNVIKDSFYQKMDEFYGLEKHESPTKRLID